MSAVTSTTSFTKVFSNSENNEGLILLEDSLESPSNNLLGHLYSQWLPSNSKHQKNIWFLNFSNNTQKYKNLSKKYNNANFIVIDYYSDTFGWNSNRSTTTSLDVVPLIFKSESISTSSNSIIQMIEKVYNTVSPKLKEKPILLIDSLSTLVLKNGLSDTCNLIRTLINVNFQKPKPTENVDNQQQTGKQHSLGVEKNRVKTGIQGSLSTTSGRGSGRSSSSSTGSNSRTFNNIFTILHSDLHEQEPTVQKQLQYISSVSIQVQPLPPKLKYSETLPHPYESSITLITKKKSGRVIRTVEYYYINSQTKTVHFDSSESLQEKQQESTPDPTADLSFNLKLTMEEKQAKDSVILPYKHQGLDQQILTNNDLIIEDPDEEDYDDEDPDEDLDI
ncbi:hypothetical protein DLAC_00738 [Tieghemostelium lacteum]|uniref:Elongator complex protein 5 n=1 Tax=Tieghemostelium lacteum TaxID=361077 RepID=A0A152A7C0_TIELA|nr:hypothetical protein DLAC_00738 [Tieghemostelium lacteum]|eukprot:KYR01947.1 hypothetical protein DLAC_00738 [Tieghemostelium lacteum]